MFALKKISNSNSTNSTDFANYGFPNCYSYSKRQYENSAVEIMDLKTTEKHLDNLKMPIPINEEIYTEIMVCIDPRNKKKNSRKKKIMINTNTRPRRQTQRKRRI